MLAEGLATAHALLDTTYVAVRADLDGEAAFYEDQRAALVAVAAFDLPSDR
jgi:hypothetical protein